MSAPRPGPSSLRKPPTVISAKAKGVPAPQPKRKRSADKEKDEVESSEEDSEEESESDDSSSKAPNPTPEPAMITDAEEMAVDVPMTSAEDEEEPEKVKTPPPKRARKKQKTATIEISSDDPKDSSPPPPPPNRKGKGKGVSATAIPLPLSSPPLSPTEDPESKTPTQKAKRRPAKEVPIPSWLLNPDAETEAEKASWELTSGAPIGGYDVPDIMSTATKQQSQAMAEFLSEYIPDLNSPDSMNKGVWASHLYGTHVSKPGIIEAAVKEVLGDDFKVIHVERSVWSLVYSRSGVSIAPGLRDKAMVHLQKRRAIVFRSLVMPRNRNFKIREKHDQGDKVNTLLTNIVAGLNQKTTLPWALSPRWLSTEEEEIRNGGTFHWTYFSVERNKNPALDIKPQSMTKVNVKRRDGAREVVVYRAGHCGICHSTTHSKNGCPWPKYAQALSINYWFKDHTPKDTKDNK